MADVLGRRGALKTLGGIAAGAALLTCPLCRSYGLAAEAGPKWGYTGSGAPQNWGRMLPEWETCSVGVEQTPIDLTSSVKARLPTPNPFFRPVPLRVANNGHTIEVRTSDGLTTRIGDGRYTLLQFHVHHESEHTVSGERFPLEWHFVHRAADAAGQLMVMGVFAREGRESAPIKTILGALPRDVGVEASPRGVMINPADMIPTVRRHFRYQGSLTTPPCSESVEWIVLTEPIEASREQIGAIAKLYPLNARPLQQRHRRYVLESL